MIVPDLIKSLTEVTDMDLQTYLWHDPATDWSALDSNLGTELGSTFFVPYNQVDPDLYRKLRYFVSAFPSNTETGVLREHVMRLNSTAECTTIDEAAFPSPCNGPDPLIVSYGPGTNSGNYTGINLSIDVCVPGNQSASPWTLSRDRQDIVEDLYIKVHSQPCRPHCGSINDGQLPINFTVYCQANTTRGYFELPNFQNGFTPGHLLEKWPDNETLFKDFNVSLI